MASIQQQPDGPLLNLVGDRVALGPLRRDLLPLYARWINDFEVVRTLSVGFRPMTLEAEEAWYEGAGKGESGAHFTVYERATLRPIGSAGLHGINQVSRTAELGLLIGEKDCWGKGYGTEATLLTLDYGFNGLSLHSILLRVYSFNQRAIRVYTRAGFRVVGRWREAHRLGGKAHDVLFMDCLATEFRSPVLHRLLPSGEGG